MTTEAIRLARLGGEATLRHDPASRELSVGGEAIQLVLELRDHDGRRQVLPFAGPEPGFEQVREQRTLSTWCVHGGGLDGAATLRAEFTALHQPGNVDLSRAPFYLLNLSSDHPAGTLRAALRGPSPGLALVPLDDGWRWVEGSWARVAVGGERAGEGSLALVCAPGREDLAALARGQRAHLCATADFLDSLLAESSLSAHPQEGIAAGLHDFLAQTSFVAGGRRFALRQDDRTLDLAYRAAPFWTFWPDLLADLLDPPPRPEPLAASHWLLLLHDLTVRLGRTDAATRLAPALPDQVAAVLAWAPTAAAEVARRLAALHAGARLAEAGAAWGLACRCLDAVDAAVTDVASREPDEALVGALLPLLQVDDLPLGLDRAWLRRSLRHAAGDDRLAQAAAYLGDHHLVMQTAAAAPDIAALGLLWATAGLTQRAADHVLTLDPAASCRVPLLAGCDWAARRVPWLEAQREDEGIAWMIEDEQLLDGWEIAVGWDE